MNLFRLSILTPDKAVFEGNVKSLSMQGVQGDFTIMARHAPMVAASKAGVLRFEKSPDSLFFASSDSLVEVTSDRTVVMTDIAVQMPGLQEARKKCRELFS
ncbi:MAG: hypothetical protein V2A34_07375 [Lentisphaerota bacterium]